MDVLARTVERVARREARRQEEQTGTLPRAMRPAVEVIARLSAERGRLKDELARLRAELKGAPSRDELERLRAERDHLAREVARLKGVVSAPAPRQAALGLEALAARLERAVNRLERAGAAPARGGVADGGATQTTRPTPRRVAAAKSVAGAASGGFLAGLVSANVALRKAVSEAPTAPEPRPKPTGGPLAGLLKANLALRGGSA